MLNLYRSAHETDLSTSFFQGSAADSNIPIFFTPVSPPPQASFRDSVPISPVSIRSDYGMFDKEYTRPRSPPGVAMLPPMRRMDVYELQEVYHEYEDGLVRVGIAI